MQLGYSEEEFFNGFGLFIWIVYFEDWLNVEVVFQVYLKDCVLFDFLLCLVCKNGQLVWVCGMGYVVWNDDNCVIKMGGIISDIIEYRCFLESVCYNVECDQLMGFYNWYYFV